MATTFTRAEIVRRTRAGSSFLRYAARRFLYDRAFYTAGSLSYTSLLSLVPLMAIGLAVLAVFPGFETIRSQLLDWILANFVPSLGAAVRHEFLRFVANAGRLSAIGTIGLAVTAVMLLGAIETAMNQIFRVSHRRRLASRAVVYWTVLTLGPLLIGASLWVQGYLAATARSHLGHGLVDRLEQPLPILLSTFAFIVLFKLMPNRTVRAADAVTGGLAAALLFAILRWLFGFYVARAGTYATLYGALAAIPLLLVWAYLSWVVVLIGAEITAALPEWRAGYDLAASNPSERRRLTLALAILALLRKAGTGGHGASRRRIMESIPAAEADLVVVLRRLSAAGLVATARHGRYALARDPETVTLAMLVKSLSLDPALDAATATAAPWRAEVERRLDLLARHDAGIPAVSLADLLETEVVRESRAPTSTPRSDG